MAKAAVVQFEITGRDGAALNRFSASLFGCQLHATPTRDFYVVGANRNGIAGGIGTSRDSGAGQVTVYVEVDDVLEHLSYAEELGGSIVRLPTEVRSPDGVFTYGLFADPAGNVIGVSSGLERAVAKAQGDTFANGSVLSP
jgi:predicted enzyme related to lactoylglutathione lyase